MEKKNNAESENAESSEKFRDTSFKKTNDRNMILKLINDKLLNIKLEIQLPLVQPKFAKIVKVSEDGLTVQFYEFIPPKGLLLLSSFLNGYYSEIGVRVENSIQQNLFLCHPTFLRIASQKRIEERFIIEDAEVIYINKVRISKVDLDFRGKNIPVSYKIVFEQFQTECSHLGDRVIVNSFSDSDDIYDYVFKTKKTVFVENVKDQSSFENEIARDEFVNLKEFYSKNFQKEQTTLLRKETIGWIVSPILAQNAAGNWMPIGYIEVLSKNPLSLDVLMEVKEISLNIVSKLRDMNVFEVAAKHRILDISRSGLRVEIKDKKLMDIILHRQMMNFDIIIKFQAPITVQGLIRSTKMMEDGSMQVGIRIQGENNRQNQMSRFYHYIKELSIKNAKDDQKEKN